MSIESTEDTVILELTYREAAAILEMAGTYSWDRGSYAEDIMNICRALEDLYDDLPRARSYGALGPIDQGLIWMDEDEYLTLQHGLV
jgi:hypothetical protein